MGSTLGSILQTAGQTGNEVGAANEANINQNHQFMMDYLANQARSRGLDIAQTGQQNQLNLGQQQVDLEKQRLAQSRWQLMPGYQPIPDPNDQTKKVYRHTFLDPITKQQTYFDSPEPPPGSPEFQMETFTKMRQMAKDNNIDLPINTLLQMSGMKADSPSDVGNKYQTYWKQLNDAAASDPVAKASLNKNFPGGYVDFFTQMIKGEHTGFSTEEWNRYVMANGFNKAGNEPSDPVNQAYERTLSASQAVYGKQITDSLKNLKDMGITGRTFNPTAYQAQMDNLNSAISKMSEVNDNLTQFRNRNNPPAVTPSSTPIAGAITNPPMDAVVAKSMGATGIAPGGDGNYYYHDAKGNVIGPAPAPNGGK